MSTELPEPWGPAAFAKGIPQSYNGLARATELSVETVRQAIIGTGRRPSARTINKLAEVLDQTPQTIATWITGTPEASDYTPYHAPAEAARLTTKQRKAVDAMIMAMVEPTERRRAENTGQVVELGSHRRFDDKAAHPPLNTPGSRGRAADKTRGEESQETGYDD